MKTKKSKSCPVCNQKFSPQGLVNHLKFAHKDAPHGAFRAQTQPEPVDTKGKITSVPEKDQPITASDLDTEIGEGYETHIRIIKPGQPWVHGVQPVKNGSIADCAINLIDELEAAVRAHQETKAGEDDVNRLKQKLSACINLLKFRAVKGDWLERELLS